jgi:hypothetical protein
VDERQEPRGDRPGIVWIGESLNLAPLVSFGEKGLGDEGTACERGMHPMTATCVSLRRIVKHYGSEAKSHEEAYMAVEREQLSSFGYITFGSD